QHQIARRQFVKHFAGRGTVSLPRRKQAPAAVAFLHGNAVERFVEWNALVAGQQPGLALQAIDRCGQLHRWTYWCEPDSQSLLVRGARTVGSMIGSPVW